jgi:hypothetical protein
MAQKPLLQLISSFHVLLFLGESGILDDSLMETICRAVLGKDLNLIGDVQAHPMWQTLLAILAETEIETRHGGAMGSSSAGKNMDPWSCQHCTFTNLSGDSCEMCGLPK